MRNVLSKIAVAFVLVACGGAESAPPPSDDPYTSAPDRTVVIGPGAGSGTVATTPVGDACIQLPSGECVKPQERCKPGDRADVIVDSAGKVVEIVCYPATVSPAPLDGKGNVELGKNNNGVVSIDGLDDGVDVEGDVRSSGNNVTVYGQGPGVSVIGGKVEATGNNYAMRGVTVKGDVRITGNNAALVLCVIEGDLIISGNNAVVADCSVLGKIEIRGNNSVLVGNEVGGGIDLGDSSNTVCDANVAWTDSNGNKLLDPGEAGATVACSR